MVVFAVSLVPWCVGGLIFGLVVVLRFATRPTPYERLMRGRRRHAEDAARAIQRMAAIRCQVMSDMDEAEREKRGFE